MDLVFNIVLREPRSEVSQEFENLCPPLMIVLITVNLKIVQHRRNSCQCPPARL